MKQKIFWILFGIDTLILAIAAIFFFVGLEDGSVSSDNYVLWMAIAGALTVIVGVGTFFDGDRPSAARDNASYDFGAA